MILVKHYIEKSTISGVGLFTKEKIISGSSVYKCDELFTIIISDTKIYDLPEGVKDSINRYAYRGKGEYRLNNAVYFCCDDSRFMNHSDNPNLKWISETEEYVAIRDIDADEELTCDYGDFCDENELCFNW